MVLQFDLFIRLCAPRLSAEEQRGITDVSDVKLAGLRLCNGNLVSHLLADVVCSLHDLLRYFVSLPSC